MTSNPAHLTQSNPQGSLWCRWEPHIHTPGTARNDQYGATTLEDFCAALRSCQPSIRALGVTDYLSIDSYVELLRMKSEGHLAGVDLLFPNIEIRLDVGTQKGSAVNAHLLFSPDSPDHVEEIKRFLGTLKFRYLNEDYSCHRADLIRLGRKFDSSAADDVAAYKIGNNQFKVSLDQLQESLSTNEWARENCLIGGAAAPGDGTAGIASHDSAFAALRQSIECSCDFMFSGNASDRAFWLGQGKVSASDIEFRYGKTKPCLHGSDAHDLSKVGRPDLDRYCWIKGDLTFESLRQACIEPDDRTYIGPHPPLGSTESNVVAAIKLSNAPWMTTDALPLNAGLVAIIGARGSGKTALADLIAAGGLAERVHDNPKSFVVRAQDFLQRTVVELAWASGEKTTKDLGTPGGSDVWESSRLQYLSQQFVDELCSTEGLSDSLVGEVHRVVFNSHSPVDREGATNFHELYEIRCSHALLSRQRSEDALDEVASRALKESEIAGGRPKLLSQKAAIEDEIKKDTVDRNRLVRAGDQERLKRHAAVSAALQAKLAIAEKHRKEWRARKDLLADLTDFRERIAPKFLKELQERREDASLSEEEWKAFLPVLGEEVDEWLRVKLNESQMAGRAIVGTALAPLAPGQEQVALIADEADLASLNTSLLQAECDRLEKLVGVDAENARKFADLSRKIEGAKKRLNAIEGQIKASEEAKIRSHDIAASRKQAFRDVFSAIVTLEDELRNLYAPLDARLRGETGALGKLSFVIRRVVDVRRWVAEGEKLLDLRKDGPFKGHGALYDAAKRKLLAPWTTGSPEEVADALDEFIREHQDAIKRCKLDNYPNPGWGVAVNQWLHSTSHITVAYGLQYDGINVELLSPGTRGIVLLMLYLAIDQEDDRPLIIDQPEENLDPQSIFDELVGRFRSAKKRRQIIIVTHNANLVVNTDADQVIVATAGTHKQGQLPPITYESGGLENPVIRRRVCDILEGGEKAFKDRAKRLRVKLQEAT